MRLARSARGSPCHVTAAGARARVGGGRSTCHGLPGEAGAWAKPTAGAAPTLPLERYPLPKHLPRSPVQSRPRSGKPLFSACAKSATSEAGQGGGCERACCPPPVGHGAFLSGVHSSSPEPSLRNSTRERSPPSFLLLFPPQRPPLPTSPPLPRRSLLKAHPNLLVLANRKAHLTDGQVDLS